MNALDDLPIIDAHHHFWMPRGDRYPKFEGEPDAGFFLGDYSAMMRDFLPEQYRTEMGRHNVVATVHVEAEWRRDDQAGETRWLDAVADGHGWPNAIVGHVWLDDPQLDAVLEAHLESPRLRGVRSKPALPAALSGSTSAGEGRGSMADPAWQRGYARLARHGLSYDLRVPLEQLDEARALAARFEDVPVVLEHTGFPWDRSEAGLARWHSALARLAELPHVCLKLSEFGLRDAPWRYDENREIVLRAIDAFGAQRCMFASNYPVAGLRIGLVELFDAYKAMVADLTVPEQRALFHDNAARFYRLDL